jgi:hypothetical protein
MEKHLVVLPVEPLYYLGEYVLMVYKGSLYVLHNLVGLILNRTHPKDSLPPFIKTTHNSVVHHKETLACLPTSNQQTNKGLILVY